MVSSKPEVANHSENGVFPAHVNAWFILSDHEQFDRNFPSDKAVTLRYWMMKSERIQHCKVKSELLLWTALKRPLHTSCQERGRLHCRKLPQRGAREHSSRPPWKDGGKCNNAQRPFFPHSTEEDCSILSTITHIQQKDQHTKSLFTLHFLLKLLFLINATVSIQLLTWKKLLGDQLINYWQHWVSGSECSVFGPEVGGWLD